MNWDQIEGNWRQVKGRVKETWGDLTEDELDKIRGSDTGQKRQPARLKHRRSGWPSAWL